MFIKRKSFILMIYLFWTESLTQCLKETCNTMPRNCCDAYCVTWRMQRKSCTWHTLVFWPLIPYCSEHLFLWVFLKRETKRYFIFLELLVSKLLAFDCFLMYIPNKNMKERCIFLILYNKPLIFMQCYFSVVRVFAQINK